MRIEDLHLLAQLASSIEDALKELERALERKNIDKIKQIKLEILSFQKQIAEILR